MNYYQVFLGFKRFVNPFKPALACFPLETLEITAIRALASPSLITL